MHKRRLLTPRIVGMAIVLMCLWTLGILASDGNSASGSNTAAPAAGTAQPTAGTNDQVKALKEQMALQQKQIEQMQKALDEQKRLLEQLTKPAPASQEAAKAAPSAPTAQATPAAKTSPAPAAQAQPGTLGQVASTTPIIPPAPKKVDNSISSIGAGPTTITTSNKGGGPDQESSPLQFHIGDATFTPVGFMDFTGVWRENAAGGSIGTSFGSIPLNGSYNTQLNEFRLSMQNSRIGFRTDAEIAGAHVMGYMEADFLGNNGTNVAVTSNSNTLRSRLYWVDVRKGGWELLGGQTWSLITPGRVGISPLPSDVFYTQDMDVNYQLGLFWGRQPELRVVYHAPGNKAAFAVAIDNPDQYVGGSSGGSSITFPSALSTLYASELDTSASSGGIGTPNVAPDIIAKLAFDPVKQFHFEIGGVERDFKVWYPGAAATKTAAAIPNQTYTSVGGAGFVNLSFELFKGFRILTNNYWGDGGGRYFFGQAPDLAVNANGSLSLLHSGSTVTGLEWTEGKTLIYAYYGGLLIGRDIVVDTNGKYVGYGYPGSPTSQNRAIQEATFGFNQTVWKSGKFGAVNLIGQYSYLQRNPWNYAPTAASNASDNMVWLDLRYTLPGSAPTLGKPAR